MPRLIQLERGSVHQRGESRHSVLSRRCFVAFLATFAWLPGALHGQQLPSIPVVPVAARGPAPVTANSPTIITPMADPKIFLPAAPTGPAPAAAQLPQNIPQPMPIAAPSAPAAAPAPATSPAPEAAQPATPFSGILSDPRLSAAPPMLGATPVPTQATRDKINKLVQTLLDPESTLDLITNQTRVLVLKDAPFRVQAGDDSVLGLTLVNPKEVLLQGKNVGSTVLNLWFGDKDDPARQVTLTYLIRVFPDPQALARMEAAYKQLQDQINDYFKDTSIRLKLIGDKVVVSGRVRDYIQGQQVLQMLRAGMGSQNGQGSGGSGNSGNRQNRGGGIAAQVPLQPGAMMIDPTTGQAVAPNLANFQSIGGPNVINLLEVAGEQQVMLRCVVAEVNRAAARSIGLNFSVKNGNGLTVFSNNTGPITPFNQGIGGGGIGIGGGGGGIGGGGAIANLTAIFNAGTVPFAIHALRTMQYARSLAEPTLVTLNGQTANFLAGGQFPIPVVSGSTFNGLQGVQYVPFGVQLSFTPYITDRDRIRLQLSVNVSTRDLSTGSNIGGSSVAGLNTRSVNNTVELRNGETLAVAGLIESNSGADSTRIPFIGTLPVVGPLTGLTRHNAGEKELVIFVTPELARPIDPEQVIKLPGYEILDPNDLEFYVWGRIEGHCKDYRSPIRTDLGRIQQYHQMESNHMSGPTGYTPPSP